MRVLLIEDNDDDALMVREMLAAAKQVAFEVECAERLSTGLVSLAAGGVDVVLLDLSLPDSQGLATFDAVYARVPVVPIVVLTGYHDEAFGVQALKAGAQDYLVKGQVEAPLLERSLRYAIERHQLVTALEQTRQQAQLERELRSFEQLSATQTVVTAKSFGIIPVRQSAPDTFDELIQRYGHLLELGLQQQVYKMEHNLSEELRSMAEWLGFLKAGPRDVVEIHRTVLQRKTHEATGVKARAYIEEGRLIVLALMGYLASFYRNYVTETGRLPGGVEAEGDTEN